jgi:hypothetical protein
VSVSYNRLPPRLLKAQPRVDLRRAWQKKQDPALRRTAFFVQIDITPAADGGFLVEVAAAPSFTVGEFELRRWPVFRKQLEAAIGCRVAAMTQGEWDWDLATNKLAPWTAAAEKFAEANEDWFDAAFEQHCRWMEAVGADMARHRAERRRA